MSQSIALVTFLVHDYDEAITFFVDALRFTLVEDKPQGGKRWVVVAPRGSTGCSMLLANASTPQQASRVGDQTGGRVGLFLHTSDFRSDYEHMLAHGVQFIEAPRHEPYGQVVVFKDLYGNLWDLMQPAT
ncbi:MAG TPA: VOC family protein [Burkholderiaceae bacterium]|nr:VOC family protein [Burkholderiaceae bacterium]